MSSVQILCGAHIASASEAHLCKNRVRYTGDHCRHHGGPAKSNPRYLSNTFGAQKSRFEKGMRILKEIASGRNGVSTRERDVIETLQYQCRKINTRKNALVKDHKKSPHPSNFFRMHNLVFLLQQKIMEDLLPWGYTKDQFDF